MRERCARARALETSAVLQIETKRACLRGHEAWFVRAWVVEPHLQVFGPPRVCFCSSWRFVFSLRGHAAWFVREWVVEPHLQVFGMRPTEMKDAEATERPLGFRLSKYLKVR